MYILCVVKQRVSIFQKICLRKQMNLNIQSYCYWDYCAHRHCLPLFSMKNCSSVSDKFYFFFIHIFNVCIVYCMIWCMQISNGMVNRDRCYCQQSQIPFPYSCEWNILYFDIVYYKWDLNIYFSVKATKNVRHENRELRKLMNTCWDYCM